MTTSDSAAATVHPLAYVVLELQVPFSPRLVADDSVGRLMMELPELPVRREEERAILKPATDGFEVRQAQGWRLTDLESTRSLMLTSTSVIYEATRYPGFELFLADVDRWVRAIEQVCAPVGYDRIGLRYVNEVRPAEGLNSFGDWVSVMSPDYIQSLTGAQDAMHAACAPLDHADPTADRVGTQDNVVEHEGSNESGGSDEGCRLESAETRLTFTLPGNNGITLKLANGEGVGVIGNAPLRRYQVPEPGPFFVVDFDGYWPASGSEIQPFDCVEITKKMRFLHDPLRSMFHWATTADFREESGVVNK